MTCRVFGLEPEYAYGEEKTKEQFNLDFDHDVDSMDFKLNDEPVTKSFGSRMNQKSRAGVMKPTGSIETSANLQIIGHYLWALLDQYKFTAGNGDEKAQLALTMYHERVAKYIADYYVELEGNVDAIIFTAGVGENTKIMREEITEGLGFMGIEIDKEANDCRGVQKDISAPGAKVKTLVIPTNEELMIALDTAELTK